MKAKAIIIKLLSLGDLNTTEIVEISGISKSAVCRALNEAEEEGGVTRVSRGLHGAVWSARKATQGHAYMLGDKKVLAMESGVFVRVAEIHEDDEQWPLGRGFRAWSAQLKPAPMRYFHGQTPR